MAQEDSDPLDIRGFEDSNALEKIADMIMARVSVLGTVYETGSGASERIRHYRNLHFNMESTLIDKVQFIRECILDLAPYFVDMDYPYWNHCWATFPQFYSANQINMDEEHNLNVLPTYFCSFDQNTMDLYSKFLDNAIYWLRKFRYVRATQCWRSNQLRMEWQYSKSFDFFWNNQERWNYNSYKTGDTSSKIYDDSLTIEGLMQYRTGYVYDDQPSHITNDFMVSFTDYYSRYKDYVWPHMNRRQDIPLTNLDPWGETYHRTVRGVPENLITKNPSGYVAEVLWFIINRGNAGGGTPPPNSFWTKTLNEYTITEVEVSQVITWGSQDQFSATEYSSKKATDMDAHYQSHRNDYKEIEYTMHGETTTEHRLTNWTDDGTRSYVKEDTITETGPWTPLSNREDRSIVENKHPEFGLVTFSENTRPCFSAGLVEPHGSLTYNLCTRQTLPLPTWSKPNVPYIDNNYCFGIEEGVQIDIYGTTYWTPILDFGEYLTELPEEP